MIALWTTAAGRIYLYDLMKKVADTPGCRLLYTDTDSLIYVYPRGRNPLPTGGRLGDLTDEFPRHHLHEYCSSGPKQYGLWKESKDNGERSHLLKIKAMTLNYDAVINQGMQYKNFRNRTLRYTKTGEVESKRITQRRQFQPLIAKGAVWSRDKFKTQRPYFCKGVVVPNECRVLDFGYNPEYDEHT